MKIITAKYRSVCPICKDEIQRGEEISYDAEAKKAYHPICVSANVEDSAVDGNELADKLKFLPEGNK